MKWRYYLRGVGLGMIVTALLISAGTKNQEQMSDAQIKERAEQLGMVERSSLVLSDIPAIDGQRNGAAEAESSTAESRTENLENTGDSEETRTPGEENIIEAESSTTAEGSTPAEGEGSTTAEGSTPAEGEGSTTAEDSTEAAQGLETDEKSSQDVKGEDTAVESRPAETGNVAESGQASVSITIYSGDTSLAVCKSLEDAGVIEDAGSLDRYMINNGYSKSIGTGTFEIPIGASEEEIVSIITRKR